MIKSDYPSFSEFFEAVHNFVPYHWQTELAQYTEQHGRLPDRVEVPTGMGKTSTIDVVVWALGRQLHNNNPRTIGQRIVHMVERQIVVDGAYSHVQKLAHALDMAATIETAAVATALRRLNPFDKQPLKITSFHGSRRDQRSWLELTGVQVIVTTATQTTLRLLCQPPATSKRTSSIHAGLLGLDSVLLFDEPHLATAQVHTIQDVIDLQAAATEGIPNVPATTLTLLGATVPPHLHKPDVSRISFQPDRETTHAQQLWQAPKPLCLVETERVKGKPLLDSLINHILASVQSALEDETLSNPKIVVILNSIPVARQAHTKLMALAKKTNASIKLVTSRTRPADRSVAEELFPDSDNPQIVVSTQTLEVGADFSVDKLITELAPWPVLAQRLGRLNRDGRSPHPQASIIIPTDPDHNLGTPASRHIYGVEQLNATGHGLLGIDDLDDAALRIQPRILRELVMRSGAGSFWPTPPRRAGLPFELALLLFSSSTPPGTRTDLTAWLRGPDTLFPVEPVTVMWRDHPALISQCPPLPAEQVEITISEAISLVMGRELSSFGNDVGVPDQPNWEGKDWDRSRLDQVHIRRNNEWAPLTDLRNITPGSTLVLGTELGGYEATFGLFPGSRAPVLDVSFDISKESEFPTWTVCPADPRLDNIATNPDITAVKRRSTIAQLTQKIYGLDFLPQVRLINEHILIRRPFTNTAGGKEHVYLDEHSTLTRDLTRSATQATGASQDLVEAASLAAFLHDHAKAIPGFQLKLGNMGEKRLLAKSKDGQLRRNLITQLPENYDHALAAARAAEAVGFDDLVCHLIGSHHGGVRGTHRGLQNTAIWVDRYRELSQRFGPWGLAWLEAAVRLADWHASRTTEFAGSPDPLNKEVVDWLAADDGLITLDPIGMPETLTGLTGPPLTLNWYATVGVLALAAKEEPQARISWRAMTPILHTTADVSVAIDGFGAMWKKIREELNTKIVEAHERFPGYPLQTVAEKKKLTTPKLETKNQRVLLTHQAIEWLATADWSADTRPIAAALWQPHQGRITQSKKLVGSDDQDNVISSGTYELPIPLLAKNSTVFDWPVAFTPEAVWNPAHGYSDVTALRGAGGLDLPEAWTNEIASETRSRSGLLPLALFGALSLGPGLEAGGRGTVSEFVRNTRGDGSGSVKRRFLKLPLPETPVTLNGLSDLVHHGYSLADGRRIHAEYKMRAGEKTVSASGNRIELLPVARER